ncbi:MAG: radical SAM protein [Candidatus Omnitrophica bacterium]|nr:radical SAM protein [Candidatus Omnitrophota bacterium]
MISLYKEFLLIYNLGIKQASWGKRMRLIRHIFYNIFLRKNIPTTVVMGLTYRCQCNCSHCSIDKDNKNSMIPEMDTTEVKKCIDEIVDLGSIKVNFFGGEPSMRSDIIELVRYASSKKLFVFLDTNGFSFR